MSIPSSPSAVLFDLDGTLIESTLSITSYLHCIQDLSLASKTLEEVRNLQGLSVEKTAVLFGCTEEQIPYFVERYWYHMANTNYTPTVLPGVFEFLKMLQHREIPMAIVTNNIVPVAHNSCRNANLFEFFSYWSGVDLHVPKPSPNGILSACETLNVKPNSNVLFIGDSVADMMAACRASVTAICVLSREDFDKRFTTEVMQEFTSQGFFFKHFTSCLSLIEEFNSINGYN
ncbi:hypothetical protein RCL1_004678 [Eukaryota sp. TZLM3-RCL]